jgi:cation diffusion facilitator CzcD-associated flavoprotein CzcO
MTKKRICVVGAGAAGLIMAATSKAMDVVVIEQRDQVGGNWILEPSPQDVESFIRQKEFPAFYDQMPSAMYPSLRTNLPGKLMQFRSFEFQSDPGVYPTRQQVLDYLQAFSHSFGLSSFIRFSTLVVGIEKSDQKWKVTLQDREKELSHELFDAIVIANGHFCEPFIPEIPGLEQFEGKLSHSISYRNPEAHRGQTVLVVGASYSGQDITRELSQIGIQVYVSVRDVSKATLQKTTVMDHVTIVPLISRVELNAVILEDGTRLHVDHILFATGFLYRFPFFSEPFHSKLTDGFQVHDLYLHLVYRMDPTLFFMGLPRMVVPFHLFEYQAEYIVSLLQGQSRLPSADEMEAVENHGGIGGSGALGLKRHSFGQEREFDYCDFLARQYGGPKVPQWRKELRAQNPALRLSALGY